MIQKKKQIEKIILDVQQIAVSINEQISNAEKVNQIKKILGDSVTLLVEGAVLIRDGPLSILEKHTKTESFFWLLDKVLLWSTSKRTISLSRKKTHESYLWIPNILKIDEVEHTNASNSFTLEYNDNHHKKKKIVLCASSYLEKLCWIQDIQSQKKKPPQTILLSG